MRKSYEKKWQAEFKDAQEQLSRLSRFIKPRIFFLPRFWPAPFGAWTYLHIVAIGPGLIQAPTKVRRYVIGHELGHIQNGHTYPHYMYLLAVWFLAISLVFEMPTITALCLLTLLLVALAFVLPPLARAREFSADDFAVSLYGRQTVLDGALWMGKKTRTLHNSARIARLQRLGWPK